MCESLRVGGPFLIFLFRHLSEKNPCILLVFPHREIIILLDFIFKWLSSLTWKTQLPCRLWSCKQSSFFMAFGRRLFGGGVRVRLEDSFLFEYSPLVHNTHNKSNSIKDIKNLHRMRLFRYANKSSMRSLGLVYFAFRTLTKSLLPLSSHTSTFFKTHRSSKFWYPLTSILWARDSVQITDRTVLSSPMCPLRNILSTTSF